MILTQVMSRSNANGSLDHHRLLKEGGRLIAIHKAKYYKREDGLAIGPGPYVAALEYASGQTAEVVGKPQPAFFNSVLRELNCPASETVMIGDVRTCVCMCVCLVYYK